MKNEVEKTKRRAAGKAKSTAGRSRVFKDKSKYNRKNRKNIKVSGRDSKSLSDIFLFIGINPANSIYEQLII
jgi:hypothetical protein